MMQRKEIEETVKKLVTIAVFVTIALQTIAVGLYIVSHLI